jgi:CheY-like chemotaxis protein
MHGATILLVEDDDDIRDTIADLLASEGYDVVPTANGREAIDYVQGSRPVPAVILLDLMMPVVSGWECLRVIRSSARWSAVPVVVVTAVTRDLPAGVDALLRKPFGMTELRELVGRLAKPASA